MADPKIKNLGAVFEAKERQNSESPIRSSGGSGVDSSPIDKQQAQQTMSKIRNPGQNRMGSNAEHYAYVEGGGTVNTKQPLQSLLGPILGSLLAPGILLRNRILMGTGCRAIVVQGATKEKRRTVGQKILSEISHSNLFLKVAINLAVIFSVFRFSKRSARKIFCWFSGSTFVS